MCPFHSLAWPEKLYVVLASKKKKAGAIGFLKACAQNQHDITSALC